MKKLDEKWLIYPMMIVLSVVGLLAPEHGLYCRYCLMMCLCFFFCIIFQLLTEKKSFDSLVLLLTGILSLICFASAYWLKFLLPVFGQYIYSIVFLLLAFITLLIQFYIKTEAVKILTPCLLTLTSILLFFFGINVISLVSMSFGFCSVAIFKFLMQGKGEIFEIPNFFFLVGNLSLIFGAFFKYFPPLMPLSKLTFDPTIPLFLIGLCYCFSILKAIFGPYFGTSRKA